MPRDKRVVPASDAALHIMSRGNNRYPLFSDNKDKACYLGVLRELKVENRIDILHYCLMDNHVHLIVWLREGHTLSKCIKQVNLKYYNYYKRIYGFTGCLWQRRFKSNLIDTDTYLLQCGKYIELNPVRARIVSVPGEYRFSSYRYYAHGLVDSLVTPDPAYLGLSVSEENRRKQYIAFVVDDGMLNSQCLPGRPRRKEKGDVSIF